MEALGADQLIGNAFRLLVTDPRHFSGSQPGSAAVDAEQGFGALLMRALDAVNVQQTDAVELAQTMITSPDEVDVHDVTIALANANLSLAMAKAVLDRGIQAYREIINLR